MMCFCPEPKAGEILAQRLTIEANGKVWLSHYCYTPDSRALYECCGKETFIVSHDVAEAILGAVADSFADLYTSKIWRDAGSWNLTLTYMDGHSLEAYGSPDGEQGGLGSLSDLIRTQLKRPILFAFDGKADEQALAETLNCWFTK